MKRKIIILLLLIPFCITTMNSNSQCIPATPEQCPDPENNGQVCPDSLEVAFVGQPYSEVATIKPPLFYMTEDSLEIALHHVTLVEVGNLPDGLTWQSNADNNEFAAGEYYCIIMEGLPDSAGNYALRIEVDVYVLFFGVPVKVATAIDSTSLNLMVIDASGIEGNAGATFYVRPNVPNPFQTDTRIEFYSEKNGPVNFEVYSLHGKKIHSEQIQAAKGENFYVFNGQMLPEGSYFYILRFENYQTSGIMIHAD